jgi:acid phosphatase class B
MRVGLDYWHVVSHYPEYFRELVAGLVHQGHEVHVVSAVGSKRAGTVEAEVTARVDGVTAVHEVVFDHPRESPELKLAKIQELGITVFYDDRDDVCRLLTDHGILAMRVSRTDKRSDVGAERQ